MAELLLFVAVTVQNVVSKTWVVTSTNEVVMPINNLAGEYFGS